MGKDLILNEKDYLNISIIIQIFFCNYLNKTNIKKENFGKYVVQSFSIFPETIKPYLEHETKLKGLIYNHYIKNLLLSVIFQNELNYEKTEIYDPCHFSVYFSIKDNLIEDENFKKDINKYINIISKKTFNLVVPKLYLPKIEDIGKCKTCYYNNFKCVYKKNNNGNKKICKEYVQL